MERSRVFAAGAIPVLLVADGRGFHAPLPRGMPWLFAIGVALTMLVRATTLVVAQRPAEIVGVVSDAASGAPVDGADVSLPLLQRSAVTDAAGRFTMRGLEPGVWTVRISRLGFTPQEIRVGVRNGEATHVGIRLTAQPVLLDAISARAGDPISGGSVLDRADIEASGARSAGDALRTVPGVVVRSTGPGAPQLITIRGMAPDAVLVLVNGVPLNDPVTGEADLSTIDASAIASITVLPGAQSARWGPRAAGGVIVIETRLAGASNRHLAVGVGSLGNREASASWGGGTEARWSAGIAWRDLDGPFDFDLPAEVGGGTHRRENADLRSLDARVGLATDLAGGRLDGRIGLDALRRGLPGRGYAPSRRARQGSDRGRLSADWRRTNGDHVISLLFAGTHQRLRGSDDDPPFGLPYADTTDATYLELRADAERAIGNQAAVGVGVGLRHTRIATTVLADDAPSSIFDAGVYAHGAFPIGSIAGRSIRLALQARVDRDPSEDHLVPSHSVTLVWIFEPVTLQIAHRSSFSPPAAGDRYFSESVGIAPNPDLAGERIPSELEVAARMRGNVRGWSVTASALAYTGDVDGMILWAPDFRFVWSPRNQDANRDGVELGGRIEAPGRRVWLGGSWSYTRITYDRTGDPHAVQLAYRPRASAIAQTGVRVGATKVEMTGRFTGVRNTSASTLNQLQGFWTVDIGISHERALGDWSVALDLRIERLLDQDDTLIFGFPEPGRVLRIGVRVAPHITTLITTIGEQQ